MGPTEKVTFEQTFEGSEIISHVVFWEMRLPEETACMKILRYECALNICKIVRRLLWLERNEQGGETRWRRLKK